MSHMHLCVTALVTHGSHAFVTQQNKTRSLNIGSCRPSSVPRPSIVREERGTGPVFPIGNVNGNGEGMDSDRLQNMGVKIARIARCLAILQQRGME